MVEESGVVLHAQDPERNIETLGLTIRKMRSSLSREESIIGMYGARAVEKRIENEGVVQLHCWKVVMS